MRAAPPIYVLWLAGAGGLCPLKGYIPSSHSTPGRGLLTPTADCASELVTEPGAGPLLPRCVNRAAGPSPEKAPQLETGSFSVPVCGFSLVQIQPYTSIASPFSSLCAEGDPHLCSSAARCISPSLKPRTYGLSGRLSQWVPGDVSVTLPPGLLEFEVL